MTGMTFYLSREARRLGTDRELRHRHSRGTLIKLHTGVFVEATSWNQLNEDDRYRTRVHAAAAVAHPEAQFSHESAATLWRLPTLGRWPSVAHQLTDRMRGGTSLIGIARHGLGRDPDPACIEGVQVTTLARTLVDLAGSRAFAAGVVAMDNGLRMPESGDFRQLLGTKPPTKAELRYLFDNLLPYPAPTRIQRVIDFGNPLSGSVAESYGRAQLYALGIPAPELQVQFFDELGSIGFVDFYWPELGLIGEVDGKLKYGDDRRYRRDVPARQLLLEEKDREDRLRRVCRSFMRLDWKKISDRRLLREYVGSFGLHPRPRSG